LLYFLSCIFVFFLYFTQWSDAEYRKNDFRSSYLATCFHTHTHTHTHTRARARALYTIIIYKILKKILMLSTFSDLILSQCPK